MKTPRIYLDTSVFGGCFDEEFSRESLRLIEEIKAGRFRLVMSEAVMSELESAPAQVQNSYAEIPKDLIEADMIVSWNFKHIVHYERIAGYLSVNLRLGYGPIGIFSPKEEVVSYEN